MSSVNVREFASGASATAGIQESIDALPAEGGVVLIPAGQYLLRRRVCLRANVTLRGEGEATVLRRPPVFTTLLAEDTLPGPESVKVADPGPLRPGDQIGIWDPYPAASRSWGFNMRFLEITQIEGQTIHGRWVYGPEKIVYHAAQKGRVANVGPALFICQADGVTVEALTIDGGVTPPGPVIDEFALGDFMSAAVLVHQSARCRLRDITVRRWFADGICVGGQSSDAHVSGCIAEHNLGIGFHPGGGLQGAQFIGNTSRYNEWGFLFCQGNRQVIVSGNRVHNNAKSGIWGLDSTDRYCVVANNCCHENGWYGIEAEGGYGAVIQGNICRNNSQAAPGRYAGLYLKDHRGCVVTGNMALDDQEKPTQWRGLEAVDAAGENVIKDNYCPKKP